MIFDKHAAWNITLDNVSHTIRVKITLSNRLSVHVDENLLHDRYILWALGDIYSFNQWGHIFNLRVEGLFNPTIKLIMDGSEVLSTGTQAPSSPTFSPEQVPSSATFRLEREGDIEESIEEIDRDEIPLDNSAGSDDLTIEHETSVTVTDEISLQSSIEISGRVSLDILSAIKTELSGKLGHQLGRKIGETVTERKKLTLSVSAQSSVVYTIIWKGKVRRGTYLVEINGKPTRVPYQITSDLSYEIRSRKLI